MQKCVRFIEYFFIYLGVNYLLTLILPSLSIQQPNRAMFMALFVSGVLVTIVPISIDVLLRKLKRY